MGAHLSTKKAEIMGAVKSVFEVLSGKWKIQRTVTGSMNATMIGGAVFSEREEGELHYREDLIVELPSGVSYRAYREYYYCLAHRNNSIEVFFNEMDMNSRRKLFHTLQLESKLDDFPYTAKTSHFCAKDTYITNYFFEAPDVFRICHDVTGPTKSYISVTDFLRSNVPGVPRSFPSEKNVIFIAD